MDALFAVHCVEPLYLCCVGRFDSPAAKALEFKGNAHANHLALCWHGLGAVDPLGHELGLRTC